MSKYAIQTSGLSGRIAVVTGGTSGIGRAVALALASQGIRVFVGDYVQRSENDTEFERLGIVSQVCDVRREDDVRRLIELAAGAGGLDILVNNAGIGMVKPITEVSEAEWDACLDTNLKGPFFGCKHAIPWMKQRGGGSIVNVASNAGLLPRVHDPVYSISKAALVALTKNLALCHSLDRIRINAICPGPVRRTRMMDDDLDRAPDRDAAARRYIAASPLAHAWGRMIDPDEIAQAALYLVSDASAMVTGTAIAIDGGKSLGVPPATA